MSLIGRNCITIDQGERLYQQLSDALGRNERLELDFTGVLVCASPFFNAAIGQLLRDFSAEQLNEHLRLTHLSAQASALLTRVIQNSRQYYSDPLLRAALDKALDGSSDD